MSGPTEVKLCPTPFYVREVNTQPGPNLELSISHSTMQAGLNDNSIPILSSTRYFATNAFFLKINQTCTPGIWYVVDSFTSKEEGDILVTVRSLTIVPGTPYALYFTGSTLRSCSSRMFRRNHRGYNGFPPTKHGKYRV